MQDDAATLADGNHSRSSESLFRAIFEAAPVGMAEVAIDGRWLRGNRKLCDILGCDGPTLASLTFQQLTHPEDLPAELALLQQLLNGERDGYSLEKRCMHACRDSWMLAIAEHPEFGIGKRDITHNINFFMNVPVTADGGLTFADGISAPGKYVELTAKMDIEMLISNCPQLNNPCNGYNPTPIEVIVWN